MLLWPAPAAAKCGRCYWNLLVENHNGLIVDSRVWEATGTSSHRATNTRLPHAKRPPPGGYVQTPLCGSAGFPRLIKWSVFRANIAKIVRRACRVALIFRGIHGQSQTNDNEQVCVVVHQDLVSVAIADFDAILTECGDLTTDGFPEAVNQNAPQPRIVSLQSW